MWFREMMGVKMGGMCGVLSVVAISVVVVLAVVLVGER